MYAKRAFVHWYVGEGMEEVGPRHSIAAVMYLFPPSRASSPKLGKTSLRWRKTTRRLAPTPSMLKRKSSTSHFVRESGFLVLQENILRNSC